jgi:hypothetical protein
MQRTGQLRFRKGHREIFDNVAKGSDVSMKSKGSVAPSETKIGSMVIWICVICIISSGWFLQVSQRKNLPKPLDEDADLAVFSEARAMQYLMDLQKRSGESNSI